MEPHVSLHRAYSLAREPMCRELSAAYVLSIDEEQ